MDGEVRKMKYLILTFLIVYSVQADSQFQRKINNCDLMYIDYKYAYLLIVTQNDSSGRCKQIDELSIYDKMLVNEEVDEQLARSIKQKTFGVACAQAQTNEKILYKNEYCNRYIYAQQVINEESKQSFTVQTAVVDTKRSINNIPLAEQYKNTPQLKLDKLHIYGITNFSKFRDSTQVILVESKIGNYAIPINELVGAKRINFSNELSNLLDAFNETKE